MAQNPLMNPFHQRDITVITDPGRTSMELLVKKGEKAGVAYRMKDGSMVYVPEGDAPAAAASAP